MSSMTGHSRLWAARAATAERAVRGRHVRSLWGLPMARLGLVHWPATWRERLFVRPWHYWWQAHLLDCLLDAELRAPQPDRQLLVERIVRGVRLRNLGNWVNDYYDDVAWLGLAVQRAGRGVDAITMRLLSGWSTHGGGGIWWRVGDDFKNVPANGPAAIMLARSGTAGDFDRALRIGEWMTEHLVDPERGLLWDGLRVAGDGSVRSVDNAVYTYCQGVYLGTCLELAAGTGDVAWIDRATRTVAATAEHLTGPDGVLRCHGDGDGGLFTGILARYLALAATGLPAAEEEARQTAARLVTVSAEAAWRHRGIAVSGPLFGSDWSSPCPPSRNGSRDLSVQLSGWMLCEAAALIERQAPAP